MDNRFNLPLVGYRQIHGGLRWTPIKDSEMICLLLPSSVLVPTAKEIVRNQAYFKTTFKVPSHQFLMVENAEVMLRCSVYTNSEIPYDDFVPSDTFVFVNGRFVRPMLEKKPLDITNFCSRNMLDNIIQVMWCHADHRLCVCIYVVQPHGVLIRQLTYTECENRLRKFFDDSRRQSGIVNTALELSLLCPITKCRMSAPGRGAACKHLQCFDRNSFGDMQKSRRNAKCPLCQKIIKPNNVQLDQYVLKVLKEADDDCDVVSIRPDLTWVPVKDDANLDMSVVDLTDTCPVSSPGIEQATTQRKPSIVDLTDD